MIFSKSIFELPLSSAKLVETSHKLAMCFAPLTKARFSIMKVKEIYQNDQNVNRSHL